MKKLSFLLFIIFNAAALQASTSITTPTVSGHWTMAGSPYLVFNNVTVGAGQSLVVDPGVAIVFQGPYSITVIGTLRAVGTSSFPVSFDVQDTTGWYISSGSSYTGGWRGLLYSGFSGSFTDSSLVSYCNFRHLKFSAVIVSRGLQISHCNFTDIKGYALNLGMATGLSEVDNNSFHDNVSKFTGLIAVNSGTNIWHFHNNDLYNNYIDSMGGLLTCINSSILFSGNNVHHNTNLANDSTAGVSLLYFYSGTTGGGEAVISNNRIYENMCHKAAPIYCYNTRADIYRNYICNNYHISGVCGLTDGGGAIALFNMGSMVLTANYTVRNNVIANNYSPAFGGAIHMLNANVLIANNTIVNNRAMMHGGLDLHANDTTSVCIRNNIIAGNETVAAGHFGNINISTSGEFNLKYDHNWTNYHFDSNFSIYSFTPGLLNLMSDTSTNLVGSSPGFVAPTLTANPSDLAIGADFSLTAGSACINAGTDTATIPGSADCAGNNRIYGTSVDIGAYEYGAPAAGTGPTLTMDSMYHKCCNLYRSSTPANPLLAAHTPQKPTLNVYPNPASGILFIAVPQAKGKLILQNMLGEVVAEKDVVSNITSFDVHALARGVYLAAWNAGAGESATQKLIVE